MNGDATAAVSDHFYLGPDGLRLYCRVYRAQGESRVPVLCLPGLSRNSRDFTALATHLRKERDVLTADLRGRGQSAWDPDPSRYQIPVYLRDVWALLDSLRVRRVLVIGTSLGALMGLGLAASRPGRIAGLVMNDAGAQIEPTGLQRIVSYVGKLPPVKSWKEAAAQAKTIYGPAMKGFTDKDWLDYARQSYRENDAGIPVPDMDPKISQVFERTAAVSTDLWPFFHQIRRTPMLVIRGETSDLLSAATVLRMAEEKPDLAHIEVPGRGHTPVLNEPICIEAIDAFIARYG